MTRPTTTAISPFFVVSNVDRTIAFYREKLGFEATFREPDQNTFFAITRRDGAQFFVKSDRRRDAAAESRHPSMRWDAYVMCQTPMLLPPNLSIAAQPSAHYSRIHTTACAVSSSLTGRLCFVLRPRDRPRSNDQIGAGPFPIIDECSPSSAPALYQEPPPAWLRRSHMASCLCSSRAGPLVRSSCEQVRIDLLLRNCSHRAFPSLDFPFPASFAACCCAVAKP
jgi:hypothetical protein